MPYKGSYVWKLRKKIGHELLLVPGVAIVVTNAKDQILFVKRSDTASWGLPAGIAETDSSFLSCALAELQEETGIKTDGANLIPFGTLSDPNLHRVTYPNGDQTHGFTLCFWLKDYNEPIPASGDENTAIRFSELRVLEGQIFPPTKHMLKLFEAYQQTGQFQLS